MAKDPKPYDLALDLLETTAKRNGLIEQIQDAVTCVKADTDGMALFPSDIPQLMNLLREAIKVQFDSKGAAWSNVTIIDALPDAEPKVDPASSDEPEEFPETPEGWFLAGYPDLAKLTCPNDDTVVTAYVYHTGGDKFTVLCKVYTYEDPDEMDE